MKQQKKNMEMQYMKSRKITVVVLILGGTRLYIPVSNIPFITRGGHGTAGSSGNSSMFIQNANDGRGGSSNFFRPTIAVIDEKPSENIVINADVTTPRNTTFTGI